MELDTGLTVDDLFTKPRHYVPVFIDARFLVALDDYLNKYQLWQTWRYLHSAWHGDQGSSL